MLTDEERQGVLLAELRNKPHRTRNVALAVAGATTYDLTKWKQIPEFLAAWNELVRQRDVRAARLPAPRVASRPVVMRVLAAFEEDPTGLVKHCRTEGTTLRRVEAACAADPQLTDLLERARDALTSRVEENQLAAMELPALHVPREKFLKRHGGDLWNAPADDQGSTRPQIAFNIAILNEAPKAETIEDGRHAPLDVSVQRLSAGDKLPGVEAA